MSLEDFGLTPEQLLSGPAPDDMTLQELEDAYRNSEAWLTLVKDATYPERIEFVFGWRDRNNREWICPKTHTIQRWRHPENSALDPFLSISDGGGGVESAPKVPELVS